MRAFIVLAEPQTTLPTAKISKLPSMTTFRPNTCECSGKSTIRRRNERNTAYLCKPTAKGYERRGTQSIGGSYPHKILAIQGCGDGRKRSGDSGLMRWSVITSINMIGRLDTPAPAQQETSISLRRGIRARICDLVAWREATPRWIPCRTRHQT